MLDLEEMLTSYEEYIVVYLATLLQHIAML
jgi:hypothetical protein